MLHRLRLHLGLIIQGPRPLPHRSTLGGRKLSSQRKPSSTDRVLSLSTHSTSRVLLPR